MQVGVKSSPDSFSAIAFILSKYRIVSSEFEEIMKLIDKEIKKTRKGEDLTFLTFCYTEIAKMWAMWDD